VRRSHRIISSSYSQQATFKQSFVRCRRSSRGAATCRTHLVLAPADVAWKSRALRIVFCDPRWVPQPNAAVTLRARFTASRVTRVRGRGERDARGRRPRVSDGRSASAAGPGGRVVKPSPVRWSDRSPAFTAGRGDSAAGALRSVPPYCAAGKRAQRFLAATSRPVIRVRLNTTGASVRLAHVVHTHP
jgi:hypothetical protein